MSDKKEGKNDIGEGIGIAGFTLGVLSIVLAGWLGIILAIVGFVFCHIQQKRNPTKLGKAGRILNVIGFVLSIVFLIIYVKVLAPLIAQQAAQFPI